MMLSELFLSFQMIHENASYIGEAKDYEARFVKKRIERRNGGTAKDEKGSRRCNRSVVGIVVIMVE